MPFVGDDGQRRQVLQEILDTETRYLDRLEILIDIFKRPSEVLLPSSDTQTVYQNVAELHQLSQSLLGGLMDSNESQFPRIFTSHIEHLGPLKQYCIGHMPANKRLIELRESNKRFARFLEDARKEPRCEGLELGSFLLEPVQRLARYPLLLRQMIHFTPRNHPLHIELTKAHKLSEDFLKATNEAVRVAEDRARLGEIQERLDRFKERKRLGLHTVFGASFEKKSTLTERLGNLDLSSSTVSGSMRILYHASSALILPAKKHVETFVFSDMLVVCRPHSDDSLELAVDPVELETTQSEIDENDVKFGGVALRFVDGDDAQEFCDEVKRAVSDQKRKTKNMVKPLLQTFIGSLHVSIESVTLPPMYKSMALKISVSLGYQNDFIEFSSIDQLFGKRLLVLVPNLHEELFLKVEEKKLYSQPRLLGKHSIAMDILEYYENKPTDTIDLSLKGPRGDVTEIKVSVKLYYKVF